MEDADVAIQCVSAHSTCFPHPSIIDRANASGYQLLAGHFTDEERPTTTDFHSISKAFFAYHLSTIAARKSVLEVGPGQGWLRNSFIWPEVHYTQVEIADGMLRTQSQDGGEQRQIVGTARDLPFPSNYFDYVFASLADGYCYPAALVELRRVLKFGGKLLLSAPAEAWAKGIRKRNPNQTTFVVGRVPVSVYSFVFSQMELVSLLRAAGFRTIKAQELTAENLSGPVSEALRKSSASLSIPLQQLAIVNVVEARK